MNTTLHELLAHKEGTDLEAAYELALSDPSAWQEVMAGLVARDDTYRYHCFQVMVRISQEEPAALYREWDRLAAMLDSSNSYHRSIGAQLLANLAAVDEEGRLEALFDRLFDLLDDDKIITARQFAQHVGRIARARPHLQARITGRLLAVEATHHEPGRKDLLKADVIAAFDEFFDESPDQEAIVAFVQAQLSSSSASTRKTARAFLKAHNQGRQA
ncbi:MAG: hypothetical protein JXA93_09130 [Anaerolineae bacterium]|nr:hypothetical protein [Anaerolineae bacterium]